MENNLNVSVIIPINSSKQKDFDLFFERAIKSLQIQDIKPAEIVVVHSDEDGLKNLLDTFDYSGLTINFIENKGKVDFCSQVNLGVENAKNEWVSILEFDDEYSTI
jgi:predicted metal-dependent TIM-barrel fold hydrolase